VMQSHLNNGPWHRTRKMLNGAFRPYALKSAHEIFVKHGQRLVERLEKSVGQEIDVSHMLETTTLAIICDTLGAGLQPPDEFVRALSKLTDHIASPWLVVPVVGGKIHRWLDRKYFDITFPYIDNMIRERRELLASGTDDVPQDLLTMMMEYRDRKDGKMLGDIQLRDLIFNFVIAGTETTANTLTWMALELHNNPDCREKLFDELDQLGDMLEYHELPSMPYSRNLFHETLRLYPAVPSIPRATHEPMRLAGTDIVVPAGVTIEVSIYGMHRDKRWWGEDAEKFDPTRWDENVDRRRYYAPFSMGIRQCVGRNFSRIEALSLMHAIYKKFYFEMIDHPDNGYPIRVNGLMKSKMTRAIVRRREELASEY